MNKPLVSVIVPAYNRSQIIMDCLKSVMLQEVPFEIIVVDDGSTDGTREIVTSIRDWRIKVIFQNNRGSSAARHRGVIESRGDWLLFLDSDDYILPGMAERLFSLIQKNPESAFAFSETWFEDIYSSVRWPAPTLPVGDGPSIARHITIYSQCYNCRFLIRRDAYNAVGGYDSEIRAGAPELLLFVPLFCRFPFVRTQERLAVVRQGASDRLSQQPWEAYKYFLLILGKLLSREDSAEIIRPILPLALAERNLQCGKGWYSENYFSKARSHFLSCLKNQPKYALKAATDNPIVLTLKSLIRQTFRISVRDQ
jgi:glycosyltransferase involved in cell wall biosynthesis